MQDDERERVTAPKLSENQCVMLKALGQPIIGWSSITVCYDTGLGDDSGSDRSHVRNHRCPVILWRSKRRAIMPNGDILECGVANDQI